MKTQDARIEKIHLDTPIHFTGLSFANSGLPQNFEALGMLWDKFHAEVLDNLQDAVQPAVQVAVTLSGKDYIVGSQTASPCQTPGLAGYTVEAGDYVKGTFSAAAFPELVDDKLQTIWGDIFSWAESQGVQLDPSLGVEVYPQDTVSLERPEMYCLCRVK